MVPQPARVGRPAAYSRSESQAAADSAVAYPAKSLLFVPDPPAAAPFPKRFETAEKLEFREQNYARAIEPLRPLTEKPTTRAEARLRIARLERRRNDPEAALAAYDRMSGESAASPGGVPYALLPAGRAACRTLALATRDL
jgi:hypothetical protein